MVRALSCLCLLMLLGCQSSKALSGLKLLSEDGTKIIDLQIEVADSESSRRLGLMYRKEMGKNEGMLFVFPTEEPRSFWMKNTFLELDMLFFDANKVLVSVVERAVPLTETRRESKVPAKYCLEVLGGSVKELGIKPGFRFELR